MLEKRLRHKRFVSISHNITTNSNCLAGSIKASEESSLNTVGLSTQSHIITHQANWTLLSIMLQDACR